MRKTKRRRITKGPDVDGCYNRMVEIGSLITGTRHAEVRVEYSALLCLAATVMAVSQGIEPTQKNCTRILHLMADQIIPEIEAMVAAQAGE